MRAVCLRERTIKSSDQLKRLSGPQRSGLDVRNSPLKVIIIIKMQGMTALVSGFQMQIEQVSVRNYLTELILLFGWEEEGNFHPCFSDTPVWNQKP